MKSDEIYTEAEQTIEKILEVLNKLYQELKKNGYGNQLRSDLQRGGVKKNGLYLPLSSVNHRILFDGYEVSFLETYINLYSKLYKEWDDTFAQFSLRTLAEMGIERVQILFSKDIPANEKNKYKLLLWLADYASISGVNRQNQVTYEKLLEEHNYY